MALPPLLPCDGWEGTPAAHAVVSALGCPGRGRAPSSEKAEMLPGPSPPPPFAPRARGGPPPIDAPGFLRPAPAAPLPPAAPTPTRRAPGSARVQPPPVAPATSCSPPPRDTRTGLNETENGRPLRPSVTCSLHSARRDPARRGVTPRAQESEADKLLGAECSGGAGAGGRGAAHGRGGSVWAGDRVLEGTAVTITQRHDCASCHRTVGFTMVRLMLRALYHS